MYNFSVCTPLLKKQRHKEEIKEIISHFSTLDSSTSSNLAIRQVATHLGIDQIIVEKALIEDKKIIVNEHREYEHIELTPPSVLSLIEKQTPCQTLINGINQCRVQASELYNVHERGGAELIFSSDGTGFGKSYGVFESYADYIERFRAKTRKDTLLPKGGFTNFLFLSPLKSQIDLDDEHKQRIKKAGGEFICVLSQADTWDLDFVDWASGLTNRERYKSWVKTGTKSAFIKPELFRIKYLINQSDWLNNQLKDLNTLGGDDAFGQKVVYEEQLATIQYDLLKTIISTCRKLFESKDADLKKYVLNGLQARRLREEKAKTASKASHMRIDEVYLEIIKQVLPFEVCKHIPSVMLMTTSKFDTTTKRLVIKKREESVIFEDIRFEHLIGGKLKAQND